MPTPSASVSGSPRPASAVLILGGTGDAYQLAERVHGDHGSQGKQGHQSNQSHHARLRVISSLAGRTANPRQPAGELRVGGFGGADGLSAYLRAEGIAAVVDATHPFAATMRWNAAAACAAAGVPLLRLERPAWVAGPGDRWIEVDDWSAAALQLRALGASGARRVLLALGRQELAPFAALDSLHFLIRSVDAPDPLPPFKHAEVLLARGPFSHADERELLVAKRIDAIVCKNSGGTATDAKLAAARELGITVLMRRRPQRPDSPTVDTVAAAERWLAERLAERCGTLNRQAC
jgi:precorrin-6A/cobalt-precorrin-6A reductase